MNAQEMHIELDLSVQKIRSNYYRQILDSEKDWILNKMVERFRKDRIKQDTDSLGFDATEIDLDALRTLVVLDRELPTFQVQDDSIQAELPGNYSYLIDDFSYTIDSCNTGAYKAATTFVNTTEWIYTYPLVPSAASGRFYQAMSFMLSGSTLFDVSGLPGLFTANETFTVRDYILHQLWRSRYMLSLTDVDFYWERYKTTYTPNAFIAVSTTRQLSSNTITIDGVTTTATESSLTSENFIPETSGGTLCNDRLVRGHFRSSLRSSAFAKTTSLSPISAVSGNQIKVYHDGKFIISKLRVSYVRKPAKISLLLSQNCDIAEEFHQEICDRAVLYIKELIGSPDWEVKLRDMMTNKD